MVSFYGFFTHGKSVKSWFTVHEKKNRHYFFFSQKLKIDCHFSQEMLFAKSIVY